MLYSNRDNFIISAAGCMYCDPNSLEAIMAGNEAGARGCTLPLRLTKDGIAVLCAGDGFVNRKGEYKAARDLTFEELRTHFNKLISFGQALELAKACAAKLCIDLPDARTALSIRVTLKYSEYLDNAYFCGLQLQEAADLAARYPDMHVMADFDCAPTSVEGLVRAARDAGLFGLRAAPALLTDELCRAALRSGLFLASTETTDIDELRAMIDRGVNFIETERPDLAYSLMPQPDFD